MKSIKISEIQREIIKLIAEASFNLPPDILCSLKSAYTEETDERAKKMLGYIIRNAETAREDKLPLCQDCGTAYIKLTIGPGLCLEGGSGLICGINEAVADAYSRFYLRKSILSDPLYERKNTGCNTPAIVETSFGGQKGLTIEVNLKGGGSENCSYLFMMNPSSSENDIVDLVREVAAENVTKCCPPVIVGVGIGSTATKVTSMAREASFRPLNERSPHAGYRNLEERILKEVNSLGIGPQGLGGKTTALACNIQFAPCHMATLPVAVFMGCHSLRRACSNIS